MDYIQEMLLEQKQLLTALMLGSKTREELREKTGPEGTEWTETAGVYGAETELERGSTPAGPYGGQEIALPAEREERGISAYFRKAQGSGAEKRTRTAAPLGIYGSTEARDGGSAAESFETRSVDARNLSRVIQRDARRYDGGFSIY